MGNNAWGDHFYTWQDGKSEDIKKDKRGEKIEVGNMLQY